MVVLPVPPLPLAIAIRLLIIRSWLNAAGGIVSGEVTGLKGLQGFRDGALGAVENLHSGGLEGAIGLWPDGAGDDGCHLLVDNKSSGSCRLNHPALLTVHQSSAQVPRRLLPIHRRGPAALLL